MFSDIRYAIRTFARTPGFTIVAVLTLALGIGATTAMFSVVNAVLLKPLPYAAADRLVVTRLSLPDYRDLAAATRSFDGLAVWASNLYNLQSGSDSQQVLGGVVSRELFPLLGVEPILGRTFTAEDDRQETVVLGYGLWQTRFGGDPAVLGRAVNLSGTSYTVVGIAPSWFRFPTAEFQLWTPIGLMHAKAPQQARNRALRIFSAIGRLKPGLTVQQAQGEVTGISTGLSRTYPETNADVTLKLQPLYERVVGEVRPALRILLGTVGLLLLIACANVANLMLARTTAREREIAIRRALGAGRQRLARQLATEALTLALSGGALGVLFALWGIDLLPAGLEARLPRAEGIGLDAKVLLFALGATVLTAILFGLAPILQSASDSGNALKEAGRGVASSARGRRARHTIIVAEIALAVMVLAGAGLMVRSFLALSGRDPGFTPSNLLSFNVQLLKLPDGEARAHTATMVLERLAQVPGVARVGGATGFPTVTAQRGTRFDVEGRTLTPDENGAYFIAATPGYFSALDTPVLRGRAFERHDGAGAPAVVVINKTLADTLFQGQDPVGRRIRLLNPEQSREWRTIVGVVGDVHYEGLQSEMVPTIYTPFAQTPFLWLYMAVRTTGRPDVLTGTIRSLVPSVEASLVAANLRTMESVLATSMTQPRLNMLLISGFALLALALAAVGIYGVVTYSVAQRTHEIGVRMALGAAAGNVLRLVLMEGLFMGVVGVLLGLAGAAVFTRLMAALLFGVTPRDPLAFGASALALLAVAVLGSWIPARRAMQVDPMIALRAE